MPHGVRRAQVKQLGGQIESAFVQPPGEGRDDAGSDQLAENIAVRVHSLALELEDLGGGDDLALHAVRLLQAHQPPAPVFLTLDLQDDVDGGRDLRAQGSRGDPRRGDLSPGVFLGAAEANGLIVPLGRWAVHAACRQMRQWTDAGIAPSSVAVSISGLQLKTPLELEQAIAQALTEFALPAQRLELELTESVLMQVSRQHDDPLQRLRDQGVRLAIDEFGTGYSSLGYLRRCAVDRIRIASSFIGEIGTAPGSDVIVKAALGLARELGVQTLAQGVERAAQAALLQAWGCPVAQGRYFSGPLTVAEATASLRVGRITPPRPDRLHPAERQRGNLAIL